MAEVIIRHRTRAGKITAQHWCEDHEIVGEMPQGPKGDPGDPGEYDPGDLTLIFDNQLL